MKLAILGNLTWNRFIELITAPYYHTEMLWIVLPLITALILMQLYFGLHKKEELGWNTAVGNSLALVFVAMDLIRYIFINSPEKTFMPFIFLNIEKIFIPFAVGILAAWILFGEFFHLLPKKFAFLISSSLPTTLLGYLAIILIYTKIPMDLATLMASILMAGVLVIVFGIIHLLELPFAHLIKKKKRIR